MSSDRASKPLSTPQKTSPYARTASRFTEEMKSRQARGKDPKTGLPIDLQAEDEQGGPAKAKSPPLEWVDQADSLGNDEQEHLTRTNRYPEESFEEQQRRQQASAVLEYPDITQMIAIRRNEVSFRLRPRHSAMAQLLWQSMAETRYHYTRMMFGMEDPPKERKKPTPTPVNMRPITGNGPIEL
jgi:hypothetical protein